MTGSRASSLGPIQIVGRPHTDGDSPRCEHGPNQPYGGHEMRALFFALQIMFNHVGYLGIQPIEQF